MRVIFLDRTHFPLARPKNLRLSIIFATHYPKRDMIKIEACFFWQKFIIVLFKARDVCEAGVVDQGVARDVHGHRCLGRKPGGDGEQVKRSS